MHLAALPPKMAHRTFVNTIDSAQGASGVMTIVNNSIQSVQCGPDYRPARTAGDAARDRPLPQSSAEKMERRGSRWSRPTGCVNLECGCESAERLGGVSPYQ